MYILQITPGPVYPPCRGGQQRMHGLVSSAPPQDTVFRYVESLVSVDKISNKKIEESYFEYRAKSTLQQGACFLTRKVLNSPPIFSNLVYRGIFPKILRKKIEKADVVIVEYPWLFPSISKIVPEGTLLVYSSHNYEPELHSHLESGFSKFRYDKIENLEKYSVENSDITLVTSSRDMKNYKKIIDERTEFIIIPNGTDIKDRGNHTLNVPITSPLTALFIGADHYPNIQAVDRILEMARQIDTVEFNIVGNVCQNFSDIPENVKLVGYVDDLETVFNNSDFALNPVISGSGSNVKMADYMAAGLPVISTSFGSRGLNIESGIHYIESPIDEMLVTIENLVSEQNLLIKIGENARKYAEQNLSWQSLSKEFLNILKQRER